MQDSMVGTVLAGKYALKSKLGQGGMGSVWHAEHVQLRSPVAIKLIDPKIASDPDALARFMREAQAAAALRSPHVVQIFDFGADQGVPYIAMELLEGESLASRLERARMLSPRETAQIIGQVARAITKAHEMGIIHRDLKPDNIFITHHDEEEIAKVLDFGIAKANTLGAPAASATRTGAVLGTPYYMSPEQADGKGVDLRTDLWALGVIAYECLAGRRPFDGEALGSVLLSICAKPLPVPSNHGRVPAGFDAWFARACARPVSERFQSARELAAELRAVCGDTGRESHGGFVSMSSGVSAASGGAPAGVERPPTANAYGRSVKPEKPGGRVAAAVIGGVMALVAVGGGVAFLVKQRAESAPPDPPKSTTGAEPARTVEPSVAPNAVTATPSPPAVAPITAPSAAATAPNPSASASAAATTGIAPTRQRPQKRPASPPAAPSVTTKTPAKEPAPTPTKAPSSADVLGI